jgi:hypothetical protein
VVPYDTASFAAGQNCGTRIASCIARLAASELMQDARWWNRRRRGAMASALFTYSEDLENDADSEPAGQEEDS